MRTTQAVQIGWALGALGCQAPKSEADPATVAPVDTATAGIGNHDSCLDRDMDAIVGVGETEYQPVSDGDPVTVRFGPAGGWMVDTAVRLHHTRPEVWLTPTLRLVDTGVQIAGGDPNDTTARALVMDEPEAECGDGEIWGVRAFIDDLWIGWPSFEEVCTWEGQELEVEVVAEEYEGERSASDSVVLVVEVYDVGAGAPVDCSLYR